MEAKWQHHDWQEPGKEYACSKEVPRRANFEGSSAGFSHKRRMTWKATQPGQRICVVPDIQRRRMDIFSENGLGGTSLINTRVLLRADGRILEGLEWPVKIQTNSHEMMQCERLNFMVAYVTSRTARRTDCTHITREASGCFGQHHTPKVLPKPQKLSVFEHQSKDLGLYHRLYRPSLTASFEDWIKSAGVTMHQSTGSENEYTGLNVELKNSTLVTCLTNAWT